MTHNTENDVGSSDRVRVAFTMRREDYDALKQAADKAHETVAGYLRKAMVTHRYVRDAVKRGARILVEDGDIQREVVFR